MSNQSEISRASRWGHPRALSALFFTELWERFSYYGMRGLLILYMTAPESAGGLGFDIARAGSIYGLYGGLAYLACLPGGWLADRFLGARRAVVIGGGLILCGHVSLAWPQVGMFYPGLGLIILGTGLLKPNVSTMVGQLYAATDSRRDSGFSLYYMGINLGAFLAPLVCGWLALAPPFQHALRAWGLAPTLSWHCGFGAAALGMAFGLITFGRGVADYSPLSARPAQQDVDVQGPVGWQRGVPFAIGLVSLIALTIALLRGTLSIARLSDLFGGLLFGATILFFTLLLLDRRWTPSERKQLYLILVLFLAAVVFWSLFEQGGSTLTLFAEHNTNRYLALIGYEFPTTWFQSLNPLLIITLAPLFAWGWPKLGRYHPDTLAKCIAGLFCAAAGFGVLLAATFLAKAGLKVSPLWLVATYVFHTVGELCLSPVGLSAISRLAPARIASLTMGVWFLASSVGNYLGGRAASAYEVFTLPQLFAVITGFGFSATVVLALVRRRMTLLG